MIWQRIDDDAAFTEASKEPGGRPRHMSGPAHEEMQGLLAALRTLRALKQSVVSAPVEFTNLLIVAKFITVGAWLRRESRGSHFRSDYPFAVSGKAQRTFLTMSQVDAILAEIESPDRPKRKAQA